MSDTRHNNLVGALLLVLSVFMFCIESAVARSLSGKVPLIHLLVIRALAQLLVPLPWTLTFGLDRILRTPGRKLHLLRGSLIVGNWVVFYYAAANLPLALSTLLGFSTILWVVILAVPLLGEKVTRTRWIATLVGFAGIMLATRPSLDATTLAIGAGLLSGVVNALIVLMLRRLAVSEPPVTIMFYIGLCTTCVFVPYALLNPSPIVWEYVTQLLILVPCGPLAVWLMILAYRKAEATAIMPVQYVRYLQAIAIGWFLFGEIPDRWSLIGGTIAVGAALWLTWPRRKLPV